MNKLIRFAHDCHTKAVTLLECHLHRVSNEQLVTAANRSWRFQTAGSRRLENQLEHTLTPSCPAVHEMNWRDVFCFQLDSVCLTGDDALVFIPSGEVVMDCPSLQRHPERKIRRPLRLGSRHITESCVYLAGRNYENHGHFLLHHLPRLFAAQSHFEALGHPRILLGNREKQWQLRYLSAVGVAPEQVRRAGPCTTRVNRLFYAPQLWSDSALASPEILLRMRAAFLAHSLQSTGMQTAQPPILISRCDAPDRKLLNEHEIAAEVERQWGACEVLQLSKLDFATQLRKFATAPLIIGALGQGFANLLVASGALCLILDTEEQWSESYFSRTFRDLALLHGNMAARLFAGRSIQKREHWSYPLPKFKQELSTATALWKQHLSLAPPP